MGGARCATVGCRRVARVRGHCKRHWRPCASEPCFNRGVWRDLNGWWWCASCFPRYASASGGNVQTERQEVR